MSNPNTSPKSSNFIFSLFLEQAVSCFFESNLINKITNTSFSATTSYAANRDKKYFIKNIPDYINVNNQSTRLTYSDVPQYKGFLLNFKGITSSEDYLLKNLSKRNRKNIVQKKKLLALNHSIRYQIFFGAIDAKEYHSIFTTFYTLLKNRFDEKKVYNRYLENWDDLYASVFSKINTKQASLFVIYDTGKPISITLNFHLADIVFSHIQAYNISYSKYQLGDISMLHHLEWCISHTIQIFDLSMGETYYKLKWKNQDYLFYHRIYYNSASLKETIWAKILVIQLKFMQFLRDKKIIGFSFSLDKLRYKLKKVIDHL